MSYEYDGTPGPWHVFREWDESETQQRDPVAQVELFYVDPGPGKDLGLPEADAQLIAAAPELFEALDQSLTSMLDSGYSNNSVVVMAARQALAKATGGEG